MAGTERVKNWSRNYQRAPETVELDESEEETEGVSPPLPSTSPPEKQAATETNMLEALEVLRIEISEATEQTWRPGLESVAESQRGRLTEKLIIVQQIYSDMNTAEKLKHADAKKSQVAAACTALTSLEDSIVFMNFRSKRTTGEPVTTAAEKD